MYNIIITGGAGFIGSHVFERVVQEYPDAVITIIDKMTYAASIENISTVLLHRHHKLCVGDICDMELCLRLTRNADCVIHLAAESHVDNSFGNSLHFTHSNTLGTHTLLESCRQNQVARIIHISTDEVYGETYEKEHIETDQLNPSNPYSASKAAADMIVNSYIHSFKLPIIIARANNIFGIRQFPEKIIPKFIMQGLLGQKFTLHGNGRNRRRFLSAPDFADAIVLLLQEGSNGKIYNVGSAEEYTNQQVAEMIARELAIDVTENSLFVQDRPFNDFRYAINCDKLKSLGWSPRRDLAASIGGMVAWYRENADRYTEYFTPLER